MTEDNREPFTITLTVPYPPMGFNDGYAGAGGGGKRKNAALARWQRGVVDRFFVAGVRPTRTMTAWMTRIEYTLTTAQMDVDAPCKSLIDAIVTALFWQTADSLGRTIYRDAYVGQVCATKRWALDGEEPSLQVTVHLEPIESKRDFNAAVLRWP